MDPLGLEAVRVLGSLIEKKYATPDNYPLTLRSLMAACNQTSNREPVMELDETDVLRGLDALKRRSWARDVHHGQARVVRYREQIGETLHLHQPELAVLSVLLLRGPQTIGEIKARTSRLSDFVELKHVEITLDALADLSTPLVTRLPRRAGQKEVRFTHLLGGTPEVQGTDAVEPPEHSEPGPAGPSQGTRPDRIGVLEAEVARLQEEVATLREELDSFRRQFE